MGRVRGTRRESGQSARVCERCEQAFIRKHFFRFFRDHLAEIQHQRVSAVSTQVVLTARKALSLCLSVWWFKNGWNAQLAIGASGVFVGSAWYALSPTAIKAAPAAKEDKPSAVDVKAPPNGVKIERIVPERTANGADPARKGARRRRKGAL